MKCSGTFHGRVELRADNPGRQVELSWQAAGEAPREMWLEDLATRAVIPMQAGRCVFTMSGPVRSFAWRVYSSRGQHPK